MTVLLLGTISPMDCKRKTPTAISPNAPATKTYVGMAKSNPDSRTPLRFPSVKMPIPTSASWTRYGSATGYAETMAATPAAILTATVSV